MAKGAQEGAAEALTTGVADGVVMTALGLKTEVTPICIVGTTGPPGNWPFVPGCSTVGGDESPESWAWAHGTMSEKRAAMVIAADAAMTPTSLNSNVMMADSQDRWTSASPLVRHGGNEANTRILTRRALEPQWSKVPIPTPEVTDHRTATARPLNTYAASDPQCRRLIATPTNTIRACLIRWDHTGRAPDC